MTEIIIDAGTLTASLDERTVTGLLVPFGEECKSNLGRFTVDKGAFEIPSDAAVVGFNREHAREDVLGRATSLRETDEGIVATFSIGDTPEGDKALLEIATGSRKHLSAEVANVAIKAGKAIGGKLFGGALVKTPAFPSATLLAAAADTSDDEPTEPITPEEPDADTTEETVKNPDGSSTKKTTTTLTEVDADGNSTTTTTVTTVEIQPPTPVEDDTNKDKEATPVANTNTLTASKPLETEAKSVFAAIDAYTKGLQGEETQTLLAALSDIKTSGAGSLGLNAIQPAWLGEVWAAKAYVRKYWGLVKNGNIVAQTETGFTLDDADPIIAAWAGNKAAVASGTGTASPVTGLFQRWAAAVDIAREFFDIADGGPVIEAFIRRFVDDYSKVTDKWALQQLVTAAGAATTAGTLPTGYDANMGKIIVGIDTVNSSDVDATFVVAAADVFKSLMLTPFEQIPQYITLNVGTQGEGTADGIQVVRDKFGVLAAGQVLIGSHDAAHLNELSGGSPLQIDALNLAQGGIDKAVHGYTQYMTEYANGLLLVGNASA